MDILFHPAGTETSSGTSTPFGTGNMGVVGLFVNIAAVSGTLPTLIVNIQHSPDSSVWYDVPGLTTVSLNGITTTSVLLSAMTPLADYVRCKWTIGGLSPSFTFTAELVVYAI